jgi:adenine-specific DNA-methyltransferase
MTRADVTTEDSVTYGEVFTRRWVVDALLDLVGYDPSYDLTGKVLVDPAAGSGAFVVAAVERLLQARRHAGGAFEELEGCLLAFDLQPASVARCRQAVEAVLAADGCPADVAAHLAGHWVLEGDYLLDHRAEVKADVVVGNPPYIRLEDIPEEKGLEYRRRWTTMVGRADVYVGFFERALASLRPDGRLGFICADRWMRNQYGAALRAVVGDGYAVEHVWTMHGVDAFESQVSAYPAITVLRAGAQGPVVVADADASFGVPGASALTAWAASGIEGEHDGQGFRAHRLPHWFPGTELWPTGSPARLALLEYLNDNFPPVHDTATGTRVGIGVATGADSVFITSDPGLAEPGRLLPLSMVRDLRTGRYSWSGHYLVNPWTTDGQLVELASYPRLRRHFEASADRLRARHTAVKSPVDLWYRTIDKVNHDLTGRPKLLLQDMRTSINPVLEPGGHYPHHNLYYIVSETWDMEVLGGLLLSRVAQAFIEAYAVRMRGATLRFQAQYLKRIRVPPPGSVRPEEAEALRAAFRTRDAAAATTAAARAYGIEALMEGLQDPGHP